MQMCVKVCVQPFQIDNGPPHFVYQKHVGVEPPTLFVPETRWSRTLGCLGAPLLSCSFEAARLSALACLKLDPDPVESYLPGDRPG